MSKNKKKKGLRYNTNKLRWSLVCFPALIPMVQVLEYGAEKYKINNWMEGLSYNELCESLLRHVYSFLSGNNIDGESKRLEVGHILANALMLSFMFIFRKDCDDRNQGQYIDDKKISKLIKHDRSLQESKTGI